MCNLSWWEAGPRRSQVAAGATPADGTAWKSTTHEMPLSHSSVLTARSQFCLCAVHRGGLTDARSDKSRMLEVHLNALMIAPENAEHLVAQPTTSPTVTKILKN
jgi:hypothetical protein